MKLSPLAPVWWDTCPTFPVGGHGVNVLKPNKQATIFTLLQLGRGQREIERISGIDRKTIRAYQRKYEASQANSPGVATGELAGDAPCESTQTPPPRPADEAPSVQASNTASRPPPPGASSCEPWREFIQAHVRLKRNATAIYQDLVDLHGFKHAYNAVKRFVGKLKYSEPEQFDRLEFAPGEEAQVDYGEGALTLEPSGKRWRNPRLFVMTLRYSRRSLSPRGLEIEPANLGRTARTSLPLLRRRHPIRRLGQPQGSCDQARLVRARTQPGVCRHAQALPVRSGSGRS